MARLHFIKARGKPPGMLYRNPVFKALLPKQMRQAQQVNLSLDAREAFEAVQTGKATDDDRDMLAGVANVVMVLAEKHCVQADLDAAIAAQEALLRADVRVRQGQRWNFDGPGRAAVLHMLDAHEQMLATFGHAILSDAMLTVLARQASGQVHRVVKVAA